MTALFLRSFTLIALFALTPGVFLLGSVGAEPHAKTLEVSRFSGKPLPRFESLRYSAVHGRQGPHLDHEILWRYERTGLPMLVVRETHGWRRVRDPDGDEVWVQARMLSEARTVVTIDEVKLFRKPNADARARAKLKAGVVATLGKCESGWCEITVEKKSGWVPESALWGVETASGKV